MYRMNPIQNHYGFLLPRADDLGDAQLLLDGLRQPPPVPRDLVHVRGQHPDHPLGQPLAELQVSLNGDQIINTPLRALEANPDGSLWQRTRDGVKLWFE